LIHINPASRKIQALGGEEGGREQKGVRAGSLR
jgi:hypothetical protein